MKLGHQFQVQFDPGAQCPSLSSTALPIGFVLVPCVAQVEYGEHSPGSPGVLYFKKGTWKLVGKGEKLAIVTGTSLFEKGQIPV